VKRGFYCLGIELNLGPAIKDDFNGIIYHMVSV
jgi:hypothetical protein